MCEAEQGRADKGRRVHLDVSMCETGCFEWLKLDDLCTRYVSVDARQGNERNIKRGWPVGFVRNHPPFPTRDLLGGQGMHGIRALT